MSLSTAINATNQCMISRSTTQAYWKLYPPSAQWRTYRVHCWVLLLSSHPRNVRIADISSPILKLRKKSGILNGRRLERTLFVRNAVKTMNKIVAIGGSKHVFVSTATERTWTHSTMMTFFVNDVRRNMLVENATMQTRRNHWPFIHRGLRWFVKCRFWMTVDRAVVAWTSMMLTSRNTRPDPTGSLKSAMRTTQTPNAWMKIVHVGTNEHQSVRQVPNKLDCFFDLLRAPAF